MTCFGVDWVFNYLALVFIIIGLKSFKCNGKMILIGDVGDSYGNLKINSWYSQL